MRTRAVVFDLWQTLVVWPEQAWGELYRAMAEHLGVDEARFVEVWRARSVVRETGPIRDAFQSLTAELDLPQTDLDALLRLRLDHHRQHLVPRPDAVPTLRRLRSLGLSNGLISVCTEEVEILWNETELAPYFDAVVLSCSVNLSKPDRRIYLLACERLGVPPEECLFVGDGANDELPGAERVGMRALQLRVPGERLTPEGERWEGDYVESLSEVLDRL